MTRVPRSLLVLLTAALGACQTDSPLAPTGAIPERLVVTTPRLSQLASLGDSVTVRVRVLDDAGNEVSGAALDWRVVEPEVLEHLGAGLFRARANGTTVVRFRVDPSATGARPAGYFADQLTDSVVVTVRQVPARIEPVAFDTTYTLLGLSRPVVVRATDARGNPVAGGPAPQWESSNADVVTVDSSGQVRSRGNGTSQLTLRLGPASWSTTVVVNATRTHLSCMRYLKRRQLQQQCVTNTVTMWAPGARGQ